MLEYAIFILVLLLLMLIAISIVSIIQVIIYIYNNNRKEISKVEYSFPIELFTYGVSELKLEDVDKFRIDKMSIKNSNYIRLSQRNILSKNELESRKKKANSVQLP